DRRLPPGRGLDRLHLAETPHHAVGDLLLQAAADGSGKRLIEGDLSLANVPGQDVFAGHRGQRNGRKQATHDSDEHETPQTPHATTPLFFAGSARAGGPPRITGPLALADCHNVTPNRTSRQVANRYGRHRRVTSTPQTLVWHVPRHSRRPAGRYFSI